MLYRLYVTYINVSIDDHYDVSNILVLQTIYINLTSYGHLWCFWYFGILNNTTINASFSIHTSTCSINV